MNRSVRKLMFVLLTVVLLVTASSSSASPTELCPVCLRYNCYANFGSYYCSPPRFYSHCTQAQVDNCSGFWTIFIE
jgi:hypothetical protein